MFKPLATLMLSLVLGAALAIDFPSSAKLFFTTDSGAVVAAGALDEGNLSLDLLAGFAGFVTITGVDEEGNVVTFEATVEADGTVTVLDMAAFEFVNFAQAVADAGGEVKVSFEESIEAQGDVGLAQAWEVANENGHVGLQRAGEAQTAGEANSSIKSDVDVDVEEAVDGRTNDRY
jgi:hypothetical protein